MLYFPSSMYPAATRPCEVFKMARTLKQAHRMWSFSGRTTEVHKQATAGVNLAIDPVHACKSIWWICWDQTLGYSTCVLWIPGSTSLHSNESNVSPGTRKTEQSRFKRAMQATVVLLALYPFPETKHALLSRKHSYLSCQNTLTVRLSTWSTCSTSTHTAPNGP